MTLASLGVWSHAAAAILFAALAIWQARQAGGGLARHALVTAFIVTAGWALLVMTRGPQDLAARLGEGLRDLACLGFMAALFRRGGGPGRRETTIAALYLVVAVIVAARGAIDVAATFAAEGSGLAAAFFDTAMLLRMMTAIGALLLVHNLYTAAAPQARWGIRLPMVGLAAIWSYDLNLYTIAWLGHIWPTGLLALRGVLLVLLAPVFGSGSGRNARVPMRLSRSAAFQSLSLLAIGIYLGAMALLARVIQAIGGDYSQVAVITIVFGMSLGALLLFPSRSMQAWLRVTVIKHFFQHRYDYRAEWLRFTDTVASPSQDAAPLDLRVVKAIADITESPGGLLLLPDETGAMVQGTRWNWPTLDVPAPAAPAFRRLFEQSGRIVALDETRAAADPGPVPTWLLAEPSVWAAVPLLHADQHVDRLVGVVILARPSPNRTLDWEDFDLLRVAGRQVASYLAEASGQEALNDARRFDEFNRRFAFIMHDIKNLVSQLSLVTRNAERHADNPAFRADMIETLRASTTKMNDLLARLSQHHRAPSGTPRTVALGPIVEAIVDAIVSQRRPRHRIEVSGRRDMLAIADPARLRQALGHLVQNAIEAGESDSFVSIRLGQDATEPRIEIIDQGRGMSAEFIRTSLFRPFASTKVNGFGVGALEARTLVAAMGGRLEVESREGRGSRFTIILPPAHAGEMALRATA